MRGCIDLWERLQALTYERGREVVLTYERGWLMIEVVLPYVRGCMNLQESCNDLHERLQWLWWEVVITCDRL